MTALVELALTALSVVVANLYYCQPLLVKLSVQFDVPHERISNLPTLIQGGYVAIISCP